jgi:cell division protein FtsB
MARRSRRTSRRRSSGGIMRWFTMRNLIIAVVGYIGIRAWGGKIGLTSQLDSLADKLPSSGNSSSTPTG